MNTNDSQRYESFVPVYDAIPSSWEDARPFIVEQLRKISDGVNIREIGWYLDEQLLSGKSFIPGANTVNGETSQEFRTMLRIVVVVGPISVAGNPNITPHGLNVDNNFTLIQLWASATNSTTFRSVTFSNPDTIWMDDTNVYIVSDGTYDRCNCVIEYIQEL